MAVRWGGRGYGHTSRWPKKVGEATPPEELIAAMFANGEQGWWFDWQDAATRFQDYTGTVPAAAAADPLGLHLDKSKGLVIGSPLTHLTRQTSGTVTDNGNGTWTLGADAWLRFNFDLSQLTQGALYLVEFATLDVTGSVIVDMCDTAAPQITGPRSGAYAFRGQRSAYDSDYRFVDVLAGGGSSVTVSAPTLKMIAGNHRYQATSGNRPALRQSGGGIWYAQPDGSDDFLVTNSIDFSACNEVTLFTALRKLSDTALSLAVETSSNSGSNNGTFYLAAPVTAGSDLRFLSKGSTAGSATYSNAAVAAPVTVVATGIGDISADSSILRINGAQVATSASDQGSGNYGNYPAYFFRRGGASNPFNGYEIASLCIGRLCTADELALVEGYFATLAAGV